MQCCCIWRVFFFKTSPVGFKEKSILCMKRFAIEWIIPGNRDTAPAGTFFKDFVEDAEIIGSTIQMDALVLCCQSLQNSTTETGIWEVFWAPFFSSTAQNSLDNLLELLVFLQIYIQQPSYFCSIKTPQNSCTKLKLIKDIHLHIVWFIRVHTLKTTSIQHTQTKMALFSNPYLKIHQIQCITASCCSTECVPRLLKSLDTQLIGNSDKH